MSFESTPVLHPVSEIINSMLSAACNPVVDLDADIALCDEDSDDDITIVHSIKTAAPPLHAAEDDIEIVSTAIVKRPNLNPPRQTHLPATNVNPKLPEPDVVPEIMRVESQSNANTPATNPHQTPSPRHNSPISIDEAPSPEIIVCSPPPSSRRGSTSRCHSCEARVLPNTAPFVRCKHVLCASCSIRAVTHHHKEHPPALKSIPVCVVPRCAAPLSRGEALVALSPALAENSFSKALQDFHEWMNNDSEQLHVHYGPQSILFPPYAPSREPSLSPDAGDTEQKSHHSYDPEQFFTEDLVSTYAPLWVWDEEHTRDANGTGAWLCAACGRYDQRPTRHPVVIADAEMMDLSIPDSPSMPHCAYARALAVLENVKGLAEVREDNKQEKQKRATRAAKKDQNSRKRYKSASSIRGAKRRKTGFAKGTGYAGSSGAEWKGTSSKMMEEKARVDREATFWLCRVRSFLLLGDAGLETWPTFLRLLLRECGLVPQLAAVLINESIMDVQERVPLFVAALRLVHTMTESPPLRLLVTEPSDGEKGRSIAELVASLSRQAAFLTTGAGQDALPPSTAMLIKQIRRCIRVINRNNLLEISRKRVISEETVDIDKSDEDNFKTDSDHGGYTDANRSGAAGNGGETQESSGQVSQEALKADQEAYLQQMRAHQFKAVPGLAASSSYFMEVMRSFSSQGAVPVSKRQGRIATEVASLCASLPLSWSSSILLRVDEDRFDFLRACIFGPEDTPYDSGAYIFDIYLPPEYPNVPPRFRLLTTGAGKVRFNPNLYSNGKVCLSLLGTWSGPSWNSTSTILQVLVSIQSLIFVSDPYFNEPGFEGQMGTTLGKTHSERYNARIRRDNAFYAIQSNIKRSSPDLVDGIWTHFRLKRRYLKQVLRSWFPHASGAREGVAENENASDSTSEGIGAAHGVSVDPMLLPLAYAGGGLAGPNVGPVAAHYASFAPGRNFRNQEVSASNLKSIMDDLDNL